MGIGICMAVFALLVISALALKGEEYDPEICCPDHRKTDGHKFGHN